MRSAGKRRLIGAICATGLVFGVVGAASPVDAQTVAPSFESAPCELSINGGGPSAVSQPLSLPSITTADELVEGERFGFNFAGTFGQYPSTIGGQAISSYSNLTHSYAIDNAVFDSDSVQVQGTTKLDGSPIPDVAQVTSAHEFTRGVLGPFSPGYLSTPTVSVAATAGSAGTDVTLMVSEVTSSRAGTFSMDMTCTPPSVAVLSIPVAVNDPPTVDAGGDVAGLSGQSVALDAAVSDPDSGRTTTWSIDSDDCVFVDPTAVDTSVVCTDAGTYVATLTAADEVNVVSDTVDIAIDDPGPCAGPCVSVGTAEGAEGATISIPITLNAPVSSDVTFTATIVGGTATNGYGLPRGTASDFKVKPTRSITIKAGKQSTSVNVRTFADALDEGAEAFLVQLSGAPASVSVDHGAGIATIVDTAGLASDEMSVGSTEVVEVDPCARPCIGRSVARVPVVLAGPSALTVTVKYATQGIGASSGIDYKPLGESLPRVLTFKPNQTVKYINVYVYGDNLTEATEGIDVVLSDPTNAQLVGDGIGHITIVDDDS
jgi:hypothetical protein